MRAKPGGSARAKRARDLEDANRAARERLLASGRGCRARWISEDEGENVGCLFQE